MVRIGAWMRKDLYNHAMMTGATSYPMPGKNEVAQQDEAPSLAELEVQGALSKGMPEKAVGHDSHTFATDRPLQHAPRDSQLPAAKR